MAEPTIVEALPLVPVIEAALLVSPEPVSIDRLEMLFGAESASREMLHAALERVAERCADRSYELVRVASGYRFQVRSELASWVGRLYAERPARYSRALLETLALVAYRQPVTRGDIEEVRGVAVSTGIMRTLLERDWIHVVGYRDVPGRPALYGTTKAFLDYFGLASLDQLPPLAEVRDIDQLGRDLELALGIDEPAVASGDAGIATEQADDGAIVAAIAPSPIDTADRAAGATNAGAAVVADSEPASAAATPDEADADASEGN